MSVRDSQIIKGLAVLMMLFLHLFNKPAEVFGYEAFFSVHGLPMPNWLSHAANPIAFFIILSGYGLSYSFHRRGFSLNAELRRVGRLFVQYWVALVVFSLLVMLFMPGRFEFDLYSLWLNVTCLKPTYNLTLWFVFPYCLLCLSSGIVCRFYGRFSPWLSLGMAFLPYVAASYFLSILSDTLFADFPLLNQIALYFYLLFPFMLGVALERRVGAGKSVKRPALLTLKFLPLFCLIILICVRCEFDHAIVNPFYAFAFILLFLWMRRPAQLDNVLAYFGRYSLMMWLCHKFIYEDLLTGQLFALRWPPLIFAALVALSWACAVLLQNAANRLADCIPALKKQSAASETGNSGAQRQ